MARPRAADYEVQRDRILARAVEAFADTGYPSASMSALADACGTSKAGLYHYYPSKEAILFDSLDRYTARLSGIVDDVVARRLPPREAVRALVRGFVAEYRHSRAYHVALLNDVKFLDEPLRERIRAREREIVEAFADALERGWPTRLNAANRTPLTMALLGMINFTFAWLRPDGPMTHDQYAEMVIGLWERGLEGLPAGAGGPGARHDGTREEIPG
ncbi:TetR/AcrR family transcriptional regulator [Burkholderiaceae bacterium FT117]|uniref:TetR/AcrR family transcriptional regulator n=1 Tax=Zeimonas sediminis TaxID=2944268 RepID=UPI0023430F6E|nr:TetR/AcrR family transcriptional regulator [Zeimonas sediminis]MCM5570937.1 TetR/AcrR family transcriptional regulator [Zeimonas sediminis]